jgi:hypothetical protein
MSVCQKFLTHYDKFSIFQIKNPVTFDKIDVMICGAYEAPYYIYGKVYFS